MQCPGCTNALDLDEAFCGQCGTAITRPTLTQEYHVGYSQYAEVHLSEPASNQPRPGPHRLTRPLLLLSAALALVLIGVLVFAFFPLAPDQSNAHSRTLPGDGNVAQFATPTSAAQTQTPATIASPTARSGAMTTPGATSTPAASGTPGATATPGNPVVLNPGFESGTLSGWTCNIHASITTSHAHSGSYAVYFAAGLDITSYGECHQDIRVLPNHSYTLQAYTQGNYAYIGVVGYDETWVSSAAYTLLTFPFTTKATDTTIRISLHNWYLQGPVYMDDVSLH